MCVNTCSVAQIRRFESHTATINDLSFDEKSEFIASCSDDGNVVVHSLYTDEVTRLKYSRPVKVCQNIETALPISSICLTPNLTDKRAHHICLS